MLATGSAPFVDEPVKCQNTIASIIVATCDKQSNTIHSLFHVDPEADGKLMLDTSMAGPNTLACMAPSL